MMMPIGQYDLSQLAKPMPYGLEIYQGKILGYQILDKQIFVLWAPRHNDKSIALLVDFENAHIDRKYFEEDTSVIYDKCKFGFVFQNQLVTEEDFMQEVGIEWPALKLWKKQAEHNAVSYLCETECYNYDSCDEKFLAEE